MQAIFSILLVCFAFAMCSVCEFVEENLCLWLNSRCYGSVSKADSYEMLGYRKKGDQ